MMMLVDERSAPDSALLLHAYLDGELDAAQALAVKQQIDTDPKLAAEFANISALQKTLRERFPREQAPASLHSRVDAITGSGRRWVRPTWTAMAASVLVAAALSSGSTWIALRANQADPIVGEIVDSHLRSLMSQRPTDVTSSERHTVKPWFNGRLPQAPQVVDLASAGFPLMGARIDVIGATLVPTLVYGRRLHVISLTATPAPAGWVVNSTMRRSVNGYNVVGWTTDKTSYWAASDLNAGELETFARLFQGLPPG